MLPQENSCTEGNETRKKSVLELAREFHADTRRFRSDEDGTLVVFALYIFLLIFVFCGIAVDVMQFETTRSRLQNTLDRAVLAAASLDQSLDPEEVVEDYFTRADMSDYLAEVTVEEGFNFRRVSATANFDMSTTFMHMLGESSLSVSAAGVAEESIGNVEISLVLDISGSMGSYSRLTNLKDAADDFLDKVYEAADSGSVSTSIVPYNTQVNVGADFLSYYDRGAGSHEYSHCLNFSDTDFETTALDTANTYEQTLHFDPYYYSKPPTYPVCSVDPEDQVMMWSQDEVALKAKIDALSAGGNTSIDLGVKWGAALLDPSTQSVLTGMAGSDLIDDALIGRPEEFNDDDTMKIMVVMTDGVNTSQYYMLPPYREGNTNTWLWVDGSDRILSIWDGGDEPTNEELGGPVDCIVREEEAAEDAAASGDDDDDDDGGDDDDDDDGGDDDDDDDGGDDDDDDDGGDDDDDDDGGDDDDDDDGGDDDDDDDGGDDDDDDDGGDDDDDDDECDVELDANWYIPHLDEWWTTPYGGDEAWRLDYPDLWAEVSISYHAYANIYPMHDDEDDRDDILWSYDYISGSAKDDRMLDICTAAKDNNIVIFSVGLEISDWSADLMEQCASSPAHFFRVEGLDISDAFSQIAGQINQLKLTQ